MYDPVIGEPYPPGRPRLSSSDHRLSRIRCDYRGAKFEWRIDSRWSADFKYERYEQRSNWRLAATAHLAWRALSADIPQILASAAGSERSAAPALGRRVRGGRRCGGPPLPLHRDGEPLRVRLAGLPRALATAHAEIAIAEVRRVEQQIFALPARQHRLAHQRGCG